MITFVQLKAKLAAALRDPDQDTFEEDELGDLLNGAIAEVGKLAPLPYTETITVLANTLTYELASAVLDAPSSDVRVARVEVWDSTQTPDEFVARLIPGSEAYVNESDTGWRNWAGTLYLTNAQERALVVGTHILRVWGYAPHPQLDDDADELNVTPLHQFAILEHATKTGFERLLADRELYQQWQTQSNNTDVSFAGLLNAVNVWTQKWERRRRQLYEMPESA